MRAIRAFLVARIFFLTTHDEAQMAHSKIALDIASNWTHYEDEQKRILADLKGAKVLLNYSEYEGYEGYAMVLYEKDGKLFETSGSHCSCNRFEGQWSSEETSLEALYMRNCWQPGLQAQLAAACMHAKSRRTRRENKAKAARNLGAVAEAMS